MSVFSWGANSHGQLGLGYESELCMSPQLLKKLGFSPCNVRCIRGGGGHVLMLDNCGRLYACGWNNRGQLGLNSTEDCFNEFQSVPREFFEDEPVESIACGWDISGCITVTKCLYVWGSNTFQQLGVCQRGFSAVRRPLRVRLPRDDTPRSISFGMRHCAILTNDNKVYIFGRLRIEEPTPYEINVTLTSLQRANVYKIQAKIPSEMCIASVACGQNHVLLKLTNLEVNNNTRRIVALGDNKFGQSNGFYFDEDVKQMAVGWTHNAVLLKDNRIFVWGRNRYGQLGIGYSSETVATPVELVLPEDIKPARLHLGSEHGLIRTTDGSIYTWGWNEHGNCGNESTDNLYKPTLIKLSTNCRLAGVGAGFCFAICEVA